MPLTLRVLKLAHTRPPLASCSRAPLPPELWELLAGEIPGMHGPKVEKASFLLGVVKSPKRLGIN